MKWFEEHSKAGRLVGGEELRGPSSSTTVRIKNGKATVTDGPFIEAKEVIGGFAIVEVKDLDEALAMAKSWPAGGDGRGVEVRPVVEHPNGGRKRKPPPTPLGPAPPGHPELCGAAAHD